MTVSSTTNRVSYNGNGSTTVLPFTFKVFSASDVKVYQNNGTSESLLTTPTHYSITINPDQNASAGGSVTMVTAPPTGYTTVLIREISATQEVDLINGGAFYADTVEAEFDKLTMLVQQVAEVATRTVTVDITSSVDPTDYYGEIQTAYNATLAAAADAAASAAAVNATGAVLQTDVTGSARIPAGTTAEQDAVPSAGFLRFNTTTTSFEGYNGSAWTAVGGGATGGGTDHAFLETDVTILSNYTIGTGSAVAKNAISAGPVTINSGVTVSIPAGSTWTIV